MSNHNPQSAYADSPLKRGHEGLHQTFKSVGHWPTPQFFILHYSFFIVETFTQNVFHRELLIVEIRLWKNPTRVNFSIPPVDK